MGKGSQTTTNQTSSTPDANAYQAYLALLNQSAGVASTPYQGYTGQEVAPVNAQQTAGVGNINAAAGPDSPFIQQIAASGQPLTAQTIQSYMSPYTSNVVNATEAQFANTNATQESNVKGNAAAQGALGGDREAVAEALTAGQQQTTEAPVIAGLENTGYTNAEQVAQAEQKQALTAGVSGEQASLTGAEAQVGAGTLQQTTQQAQDTQAMQDYYQQQGYPFQVAQWLAGIQTGVGSQMGGTSAGATTGPAPNPWAQVAGGALAAGAILGHHRGGRVAGFAGGGVVPLYYRGGRIAGFAGGGAPTNPWTGAHTWVPVAPIHGGSGAPHPSAPAMQKPIGGLTADQMKGVGAISTKAQNSPTAEHLSDYQQDLAEGDAAPIGDYLSLPSWRGGRIAGFADGGSPWGGAESWVPTDNITAGSGAPKATAPSLPSQTATSGLGSLLSGTQLKGLSNLGTAFSNSSAGDAASDFMQDLGEWRGGRIKRYATGGFADGGDPTFDDRFSAAYPNVTAGIGASAPAYDVVDQSYRMDPIADDRWRARVDRDNGRNIREVAQDQGEPAPAPVMAQGDDNVTAGISAIRKAANLQDNDTGLPESTSAYGPEGRGLGTPQAAPAPQEAPPEEGGLLSSLGIKMTPELRQGLLQAGLSMMATTRGGPGSFLGAAGEAGMAGVGAYNKSLQLTQEAEEKARAQAIENEKLKMQEETHQETMAVSPMKLGPDGKTWVINPDWQKKIQIEAEAKAKEFKPQIMQHVDPETGQYRYYTWDANKPGTPPKEITPAEAAAAPGQQPTAPVTEQQRQVAQKGVVGANAELMSAPYNYGRNAPYIEKGMDVPEPAPVAGKSTQALKAEAEMYLQTGKVPIVSRGNSPVAIQQQNYKNAVQNYAGALAQSRGMTPEQMADAWRTAPGMLRFILGPDGRATVSLGTAVRHLDTLKQYIDAFNASDYPRLRQLQAVISREFGDTAATNIDTASSIVGPEIIKAIGVAGAGTMDDRQRASEQFLRGSASAAGAIQTVQKLLGGQLEGKERQAENAGVSKEKFRSLIGERPYELLKNIDKGGGAPASIAKPTLQEFLPKAKAANPHATEDELKAYYTKKYGGS